MFQPGESEKPTPRVSDRQWIGSLSTSTGLHIGLLCVIALCWRNNPAEQPPPSLDSKWVNRITPEVELEKLSLPTRVTMQESGGSTGNQSQIVSTEFVSKPAEPTSRLREISLADVMVNDDADTDFGAEVGEIPQGGPGNGTGSGNGNGNGNGAGTGEGFFGSKVEGKKFVFVLDCSNSMNAPHNSESKTRFRRLKLELLRAIGSMTPEQQFFIIFFNDRPKPMPANGLQPAYPVVQHRYLSWMSRVKAVGDTNPIASLSMGLKMQPDVIYFLTDGSFPFKVKKQLESLQQPNTIIHTYALGEPAAEELLKTIAKRNRGEYHFVP